MTENKKNSLIFPSSETLNAQQARHKNGSAANITSQTMGFLTSELLAVWMKSFTRTIADNKLSSRNGQNSWAGIRQFMTKNRTKSPKNNGLGTPRTRFMSLFANCASTKNNADLKNAFPTK